MLKVFVRTMSVVLLVGAALFMVDGIPQMALVSAMLSTFGLASV